MRVGRERFVQGDGVRVTQPIAQVTFEAPSGLREVRAYRRPVLGAEQRAEARYFPKPSTPCVLVRVAP